jgi:hypothetical protein
VSPVFEGFLATGALLLVLGLVGWGVGFAAALMRTSLRVETLRRSMRASLSGLALGLVVAAGSLYAYLVVLDRVGIFDF